MNHWNLQTYLSPRLLGKAITVHVFSYVVYVGHLLALSASTPCRPTKEKGSVPSGYLSVNGE